MIAGLADTLACFRLTKLVLDDKVADPVRDWILARHPADHGLGFLITCPWCASPYIAAGIVVARRLAPRWWGPLADVLAMSAVTGLLFEHEP